MLKTPIIGHCPLCFHPYVVTLKKKGIAAIKFKENLTEDSFIESWIVMYTILSDGSNMRVSCCKGCGKKMTENKMQKLFDNTKIIDKQAIDDSEIIKKENKPEGKKMVEMRTMMSWGLSLEEAVEKLNIKK